MDQLASEVDSISSKTNFNKVNLLDGSSNKVTMQVGIDASDSLDIDLQKTDVASLKIGSSGSTSSSTVVSERMATLVDQAAGDIKINGKDAFASNFVVATSPTNGAATNVSGAVDGSGNNGVFGALSLATKINTNTSEHNVTAEAFNIVRAKTNTYVAESFAINGTTVQSRATAEDWATAVTNEISNVTANVDKDGFLVYSNENGATINFAANSQGITADNYGGFVRLTSTTGESISIEAGSSQNGYVADTGNLADVLNIGFNEISTNANGGVSYKSVVAVDGVVLQASDGLKINDVLIGKLDTQSTDNFHATDKAEAINALTTEHGVTAKGFNQVKITVDLVTPTMSNHSDISVNGITVNASSVTTIDGLVTAFNDALRGNVDVVASTDLSGNILLTSDSGLTITVDDDVNNGAAGALIKTAVYMDGTATTDAYGSGAFTARGFLELSNTDGSAIVIEDGQQDNATDAGSTRIGFASANEEGKGSSSGVSVASVEAASSSLARLDKAIETISTFRAGFGAYENRLDAAINNLTTLQVNTDAARSRIEDADFAAETSQLTKSQILSQAATSMLAQANASKQNLLALLQG
jgi:flagellin